MTLSSWLPAEAVLLHTKAADWRAAVVAAGEGLSAAGATSPAYTDEMIAVVEELGPYIVIAPGFALAHSRPSPSVHHAGLSWVTLAEPVEFGAGENDPVDLVVGLAALDHSGHIEMMSALAAVLSDEDTLAALRRATSVDELHRLLDEAAAAQD